MKITSILVFILGVSSVLQAQWPDSKKAAANASESIAQPTPEAVGPTLFADALFWQAEQLGSYGIGVTTTTSTGKVFEILVLSFPWDWGLRTGVRYDMDYDQWSTQLYYTWFHSQTSTQAASPPASLLQGSFNAFGLFTSYAEGKLEWSLLFNMFDWELGRNCAASKTILLRPFLGVKGGWIYQNISAHFQDTDFSEHIKNDFYGVGPKGGVNGKWAVGNLGVHDFSLFGDLAGAFMWGHWSFQDVLYSAAVTNGVLQTIFPDKIYAAFMMQTLMGLQWDVHFKKSLSQFSVRLGYEMQFWLNQLQMLTASSGTTHHDLTLQGGTFEACYKF